MGFETRIGEWDGPQGTEGLPVAIVEAADAPSFDGDDAGRTNRRRPTYGAWEDFCRTAGLRELLLDRRVGLMRDHPGTEAITLRHVAAVEAALDAYKARSPHARPGFSTGQDAHLARLEWLAWWLRWAVATCARPALHNC